MNETTLPKGVYLFVAIVLAISAVVLVAVNSYMSMTLTLLVLAIFVGVFAWQPRWGLYAMAFCLPLINLNFLVGPLIIPFIDMLALVCLVGFSFHLFFNPEKFFALKFPFFLPFFFFWLATLASATVSPHLGSSLWYSCRWILFFYMAYVFFPVNIIRDYKVLKKVLISFLISAALMAIMGVISLKDQSLSYDPFRFTVLTINNHQPFGLDQNLLVETLLPGIFFLLALRYWNKKPQVKKLMLLLGMFLTFVLLGTFSRGGWISLTICLLLYLIYCSKLTFKQVFLRGVVILVLLSPLFVHMFNLQTAYTVGVGSNQTRWLSTTIAWENFKESPWLGKGTGEYLTLIDNSIRFRAQHGNASDSNGVIQKVMAENGILGLVTFFALSFYIFFSMYRSLRSSKLDRRLILPICLGALSIFIFEFFNTSYYHGKTWLPIAIAWAATMIQVKEEK